MASRKLCRRAKAPRSCGGDTNTDGTFRQLIDGLATFLHGRLARGPYPLARAYIWLMSWTSRTLLPVSLQRRVRNSICSHGHKWPEMGFRAHRVRLGTATEVALVPHWDEFDQEALFLTTLEYETPVFAWLEDNVADTYDLILEIGANAGLYTVFFDALLKHALLKRTPAVASRKPRVVAFEPSREAYRRLIANLAANDARHVTPYQAAIGETSGLVTFFEPKKHLTNGSLLREFSAIFTDEIEESVAVVLAASELARWLAAADRALLKIDVEGYEPTLLTGLAPLLRQHHPDILIEVLPYTLDALNDHPALAGYDKYLLLPGGPEKASAFHASNRHRDWLLRWPSGGA